MSGSSAVDKSGKPRADGISARLLMLVTVSAVFVTVVNGATVNVALPTIQKDFGVSEGQASWVITGYLLVFAVGIPLYGRLADVYSLRKAFSFGLAVFAVGSLVCALSPSLTGLVGGRVVQAAGAAAIPALSTASVAKLLPPGKRGGALGLIVSSVGVGATVGPIVGGVAIQFAGWPVLFYGVLVLALVLLPGAIYVLPDDAPEVSDASFDLPGGILLALSAALALFSVTQGQASGFFSVVPLACFFAAATSAFLFARRIRQVPEPFVSPRLLRNRAYLACSATGFLGMFANLTCVIFVPLLLVQVNGLSTAAVGLVLAPGAVAVAVLSPLAGRLSDRFGTRPPILMGLSVMIASILILSTYGSGASPLVVGAAMLGMGVGFSGFNSPNTNAAAASLQEGEIGVGLGIYQMFFFLGGGFGPPLLGAFFSSRRDSGEHALNPLYALGAPSYSDVFLLLGACALCALLVMVRRTAPPAS